MRYFSILLFLAVSLLVVAQDFSGIHTSRYFPLQNLSNQPADLVRSNHRWYVNVLSAQIGLMNNVAFNESDLLKQLSKVGMSDLKYFFGTDQSLLYARGKIMLPAISYKINANHAVAFSMNLKADGLYRASNDDIAKIFIGIDNPELQKDLNNEYFKSVVNTWTEYALTWSGKLLEKEGHLLTGGATLKYLVGGGSGYLNMDGLKVQFDRERIDYFEVELSYAMNKNLTTAIEEGEINLVGDKGVGLDIGASYSFLPEELKGKAPYKFKVGLMVGDMGSINHSDEVRRATYRITINDVPYSRFEGINSIEALIDSLQKSVGFEEVRDADYRMALPTTVLLSGDYCVTPKWFISGLIGYQPSFYSRRINVGEKNVFRANMTPRFETSDWGAYLPMTYNNRVGWSVGLAARWRYLFVGSGSILSGMLSDTQGRGDLYFGLNIPIGKVE